MKNDSFKYRILDANLNRIREALRVIEDIVRFSMDDKKLFNRLKRIRHDLSRMAMHVYPKLLAGRNSRKDVSLPEKESARKNIRGILIANFKRAEEAARVLEEFAKLISIDAGYEFKRIRFRLYNIEKDVLGTGKGKR